MKSAVWMSIDGRVWNAALNTSPPLNHVDVVLVVVVDVSNIWLSPGARQDKPTIRSWRLVG